MDESILLNLLNIRLYFKTMEGQLLFRDITTSCIAEAEVQGETIAAAYDFIYLSYEVI